MLLSVSARGTCRPSGFLAVESVSVRAGGAPSPDPCIVTLASSLHMCSLTLQRPFRSSWCSRRCENDLKIIMIIKKKKRVLTKPDRSCLRLALRWCWFATSVNDGRCVLITAVVLILVVVVLTTSFVKII